MDGLDVLDGLGLFVDGDALDATADPAGATSAALAAAGYVAPLPKEFVYQDPRPSHPPELVYIASRPLSISGRRLEVGDLLAVEEVKESGSALQAMVRRGDVIELYAHTGLPALFLASRERIRQLEQTLYQREGMLAEAARQAGLLGGDRP